MDKLPRWADVVLVPLICLIIAFAFCGILIAAIGQSPLQAIWIMIDGSFGTTNGLGYTLYYATNFIFTGLAVSIAFQASLFNIGGEGQATLGGLGVALSCLLIPWPHWSLALLGSLAAGAAFGGAARSSAIAISAAMASGLAAPSVNARGGRSWIWGWGGWA